MYGTILWSGELKVIFTRLSQGLQTTRKEKRELDHKQMGLSPIRKLDDGSIVLGVLFLKFRENCWKMNNNKSSLHGKLNT